MSTAAQLMYAFTFLDFILVIGGSEWTLFNYKDECIYFMNDALWYCEVMASYG